MRLNALQRTCLALSLLGAAGLVLIPGAVSAYGQATNTSGAIQGTITDPSGSVVPNAAITVTSVETSQVKALHSDASGLYSVSSLVPGHYTVEVSATGFGKKKITFTVQIGNTSNGNIKLAVGSAAAEEVLVSADETSVNTSQSTVGGVLTAQQIDDLPVGGRNFLDLAQLEPGVQLQSGESFDPTKAGYSSVSINGINGRTARILLDGQDISDEFVGTTTLNVSQGSIEEFQLSRSSLDISNELTSSGAITVSTRSGSNQFHGEGFGIFRDARSGAAAQAGVSAPFQRNQMGGRLAGPILKDKVFAFGSVERIKQDTMTPYTNTYFPSYNGTLNTPFRDNYYVGRADYNAPKGIHAFFRIAYEDNLDDANKGYGYALYGNKDNTPAMAGGADFVSGNFSHSVRGSYLKFHNEIADQSSTTAHDPIPGIFMGLKGLYTGPNYLAPQKTFQSDKQLRYDGTYTLHNHVFAYGASLNRILSAAYASFYGLAPYVPGYYANGSLTGDAADPTSYEASRVRIGNGYGYSTEHSGFGMPAGGMDDWRIGVYFGDTWKINQKLVVNYGVRYGRDTGRNDADLAPMPCSEAVAAFGASSPCTSGNLLDQVEDGLGNRVRQPNTNFGPKAGFAYDLKGDGKTVIRGGIGLYWENNVFNNGANERAGKLAKGLFFSYKDVYNGASSVQMPDGTTFTAFSDGTTLATLWGLPISKSGPYFAQLQSIYQTETKANGASTNSGYIPNTLSTNESSAIFAPNYRTPRSVQINIGVQHEFWKGGIFTADYVRSISEHFSLYVDKNHVGDSRFLNTTAAQNAIAKTLGSDYSDINAAIQGGTTIYDFASNGLDSGTGSLLSGDSAIYAGMTTATGAAFAGRNPNFGVVDVLEPVGRSVYNGLQLNFRQEKRIPLPGIRTSNFEISYALSRFISSSGDTGGSGEIDQNFDEPAVDNNNPLGWSGPTPLDRTHMISFGGAIGWVGGVKTSFIGHYTSAAPTSLYLYNGGNTNGEIFHTDLTGDGTTQDILPGYKAGAYGRTIKTKDLPGVIKNYNAKSAGKITPAGQALVDAGLFTEPQLVALGATTRTIAAPPAGQVGNGSLRSFDLTLSKAIKWARLGKDFAVEPSVSAYNVFNFANFSTLQGELYTSNQKDSVSGTTGSYSSRIDERYTNGSGTYAKGAPRVLEYGLKVRF